MSPALVAGLAAGAAVLLARPLRPRLGPLARWSPVVLVVAVAAPGAWLALRTGLLVPGLLLAVGAVGAQRWWAVRRRRQAAEAVTGQVSRACEGLAADLGAGLEPGTALGRTAREWPLLGPVLAAHGLGGSVPDAMRAAASTPGAGDLRVVAAAWDVGRDSGPGLAAALDRVAASLRADRATARVVAAELASARATARLLAVLPLAVLLMGSGAGGDPWAFLLRTPPGWACLGLGLLLLTGGLVWIESLAARVTR
ncbi:type II secretion system protein [Nocardioides rotundus]|uniref:type II secretion system F family protein n=1 Tax=Nocardioides rotundus TaxID=1774216 RepID=UPI001CBF2100|nr:type II secretion system F family protein [Nocardioides rotundus]UAL29457.1 type II secretion system protein [Nocardioides rotundus]